MRLDALLAFERLGHVKTPGLLSADAMRSAKTEIDRLYAESELNAYQQKVRVLLGEDALQQLPTVAAMHEELARLPDGSVPFLQLFNLWRSSPKLLGLLSSKELAGTAADLLGLSSGERLRLYQDSLFVKRSGDGVTNWHTDLAMAPLDTNRFVTVWLPLQPVASSDEGGTALIFASGSHRDVALPFWHGDPRSQPDLDGRGYVEGEAGAFRLGDANWHHGWTLHCAPGNELRATRRALAASYFVDGATRLAVAKSRGAPDDEDCESYSEWLKEVRPGKPAKHALLPIVWPPRNNKTPPKGQHGGAQHRSAQAPVSGGTNSRKRQGGAPQSIPGSSRGSVRRRGAGRGGRGRGSA